jgi:hypothetical protein
MSTKHTPGPWETDSKGPFLCGGDSRGVDAVSPCGTMVMREICAVMLDTGDGDESSLELLQDLANLRLIAAAPDLLAALVATMENDGFFSTIDSCECGPEGSGFEDGKPCYHILAHRAIAKATGEAAR